MNIGERIRVRRKAREEHIVYLSGRGRVIKSVEGEVVETTPFVNNAITTRGFEMFLELLVGNQTRGMDTPNAELRVGTGNQIFPCLGVTEVTSVKPAPSVAMRWLFEDTSNNNYNASTAALWRKLITTGENLDAVDFNSITTGWGSKPAIENWRYEIIIDAYTTSSVAITGLRRMLQILAGEVTLANRFTPARIRLQPLTAANANVGSAIAPPSTILSLPNRMISWKFTSADGQNNGVWGRTAVTHSLPSLVDIRRGGCKQDGSSCGTKAAGEEWEYDYDLIFAQGS